MDKYQLLYEIKSPQDIKNKSIAELNDLAKLIREFIIERVSEHGGHLSSNLGAIEAVIALHYVFDSPNDKIIFDVGHQCYTHKILTGRSKEFDNFRCLNGLNGFPKYTESPHDVFETGHSSTAISALCGFLEEKKYNPDFAKDVIAFVGDGALQSGLSLAGVNYLATMTNEKGIIILNDNEMSISKNVGGLAKTFNKLRIKHSFKFVRKITSIKLRDWMKSIIYRNVSFFSQLKYTYLGPIDGHNIEEMIKYFNYAKKSSSSTVIHIKTIKGKGYDFAENDKTGYYHGLGAFNKETGVVINKCDSSMISFSNAIGENLIKLFDNHSEVKIISPAMVYGSGLLKLQEKYPERIVDVGIAEENAVVMASALSRGKTIPIVATYSTFIQRSYDEIEHDVIRSDSHVIFLLDRAGIVPNDGDTHQGIFDIPMFNSLPNVIISAPSNYDEIYELLELAIKTPHPFVIRYPKCSINRDLYNTYETELGKWKVLLDIKEKNIITYGNNVNEFKEQIVLNNKNVGLINAIFIKPIDFELLKKCNNTELIIYEDCYYEGSLSTKIIEACYENNLNIKITRYNLKEIPETGTIEELKNKYNLNISKIVKEL